MRVITTSFIWIFAVIFSAVYGQNTPTINSVEDILVSVNSWEQEVVLSGITDGDDGSQELSVSVNSDNNALFSKLEIDLGTADTSLVFQPATDVNGKTLVTITVSDLDGDKNISFYIIINAHPTIDTPDDIVVNEDIGTIQIQLTGISAGPNEEQDLMFTFYSSNKNITDGFTFDYIAGDSDGTLSIATYSDSVGTSNIQIQVIDDNIIDATTVDFDLTILPVNDAPTLDAVDDVNIENYGIEHTIDLAGISEGPANETNQTLTLTLSSDNSTLLSDLAIDYFEGDDVGVLKYTPVTGEDGVANVTVRISDNGGTINGGVDYLEQTFKIYVSNTVTAVALDQEVRLVLYPNPVSNLLGVTLPETVSGEVTVEVYSVNGEKVLDNTYTGNGLQIPVSSLSTGWYQISITAGENVYSGRFLVNAGK